MASGGYRPNSGPIKGTKYAKRGQKKEPKKPDAIPQDIQAEAQAENLDPLTYMLKVMNDPLAEKDRRDRMAIAAAPFVHSRIEGKGKKDDKKAKANAAGVGKFAPGQAPLTRVK